MIIEQQVISKILTHPESFRVYLDNNVSDEYFSSFKDEFNFIYDHYSKYRNVPNVAIFLNEFDDFDYLPTHEHDRYLIEELKEEYLYNQGKAVFVKGADLLENYSYDGLEYIIQKAKELLDDNTFTEGTNLRNLKNKKLDAINTRKNYEGGLTGIPSGFKELDDRLHGWQSSEELVCILARVNQGKSWILQKFLTHANMQGKKVLLFSGEMSAEQVGFRCDTLNWNFSNNDFSTGDLSDRDLQEYEELLTDYEENGADFIVVEPKDIGNRLLTVSKLKTLIEKFKPDIVGIDQLSFMEDERATQNTSKREKFGNITIDLFNTSTEFNVPILLACQANRDSAKNGTMAIPGLTDIGDSDLVGQNASRVISFVQNEEGNAFDMEVPKNRYGARNFTLRYKWDINTGEFEYQENIEGISEGLKPRKSRQETDDMDITEQF